MYYLDLTLQKLSNLLRVKLELKWSVYYNVFVEKTTLYTLASCYANVLHE